MLEYEEQLEKLFMAKTPIADIEQAVCFGELTRACVGVDATNPQNRDPSVYIDGEKTDTKRGEVGWVVCDRSIEALRSANGQSSNKPSRQRNARAKASKRIKSSYDPARERARSLTT